MNASQAIDYSSYTNGTMFLVLYEIAHSLGAMQKYADQQWRQYLARFPGLTHAQLDAAYPTSPEFAANEARTNTVARAIAEHFGLGATSLNPPHGYQVC